MSDETHVLCGTDIAELKPTCELRFVPVLHRDPLTGGYFPNALQQKWVASAKMQDGGMWEEHRWRNVPVVNEPIR